jgi:formate hydrogenlyase subunit 3/multisubunit Na+/H+ antiporter MnhD subunit
MPGTTIDLLTVAAPWPALTVIVPLLGMLAAILLGPRAVRLVIPVAAAGLITSFMAAGQVIMNGPVFHDAGGWPAPLGIGLRLDGLAVAFLMVTALVTGAVALFARPVFGPRGDRETRSGFAFWPLLFAMWAALNAVFVGNDLFNLFVALELLTLTAVAMVALDGTADTIAAAMRYLLFAMLGSLAYLIGVVFLYAAHGTLDMRLLKEATGPGGVDLISGALMTAGLMAKTAIFPLHAWLPPAHADAPAPASAMLSALVVKASFYMTARLWIDVLPAAATIEMTQLLGAFGAGGIVFGSLLALRQPRLKLVVAYSTVAQLGYLFLIFPLAGSADEPQPWAAAAWSGGMIQALSHALAKSAMFLSAGLMLQAAGHDRIEKLTGIGRDLPIASFAFGLAAVSLMGLPPSGGFTAKYLLLTSALASGQWWWGAVIIVGGLLAAAYLFRVLNRLLAETEERDGRTAIARRRQIVPLVLACGAILLGIGSLAPYDVLRIGRPAAVGDGM